MNAINFNKISWHKNTIACTHLNSPLQPLSLLVIPTSALIPWSTPHPDPPSPIRGDDTILAERDANGGVRMYGADGRGLEYGDVGFW